MNNAYDIKAAEVAALLKEIETNPKDPFPRSVLQDYLREINEDTLADWWSFGAEAWLRDFASKCVYEYDDGDKKQGEALTFKEVMIEADDWVRAMRGVNRPNQIMRFSEYQLTTASELMCDDETNTLFWLAYEVVRGKRVPEVCKGTSDLFNCTC